MKYLLILVVLVVTGLGLWRGGVSISELLERSRAPKELLALVPEASPSIVYQLDKKRWTSFPIPPGQNPLKVLSSAGLPDKYRMISLPNNTRAIMLPDDQEWQYALEYQVLDSSGKVLKEKIYHHRTKLTWFKDEIRKREYTAAFFLTPRLQPADAKVMLVNLDGLENPKTVRLRLAELGPELQTLFVRVYGPQQNPEFKLRSIWQRMTDRQKFRLAGGNVYPKELVEEIEKQNMTAVTWMPIGPSGVQQRDFIPHEIYTLVENEAEPINPPGPQAGLSLDRNHAAIIPLGEEGGDITLRFTPLQGGESGNGNITVRWYGRGIMQRSSRSIPWQEPTTKFSARYKGGMLEVLSNRSLVVRAYRNSGAETQEITPEPFYLRTYLLEPGIPLDFPVEHEGQRPTPFRLDLRRLAAPGSAGAPVLTATWQLLDSEKNIISSGPLKIPFVPTPYETVVAKILPIPVNSMSVPFHFMLAPKVRYLRIVSSKPLLVAAYNRPYDLPYRVSVPLDYYRTYEQEQRQAAWFPLYHPDHDSMLLKNRTMLLVTQINPPIDDPELVAGRYSWETFHPLQKNWTARRLVTLWDPAIPFHDDALPAIYRPLANNTVTMVQLQAEPGVAMVEPVLIYQQQGGGSGHARVAVDGRTVYDGILTGLVGEIRLLPLKVGRHKISVQGTPGSSLFINQSGPAKDSRMTLFANRFTGDTISFALDKTKPDEMLSLRYFAPKSRSGKTVTLRVLCEPLRQSGGPWTIWTFRDRYFTVRLDAGHEVFPLGSSEEKLVGGESVYLPLGDDLAPGRYQFRVITDRPAEGYLALSRTTPGAVNKRIKVQEDEVRHVEVSE